MAESENIAVSLRRAQVTKANQVKLYYYMNNKRYLSGSCGRRNEGYVVVGSNCRALLIVLAFHLR